MLPVIQSNSFEIVIVRDVKGVACNAMCSYYVAKGPKLPMPVDVDLAVYNDVIT